MDRMLDLVDGGVMPEFLRHYGMRGGRNVRKGDIYTASKLELEKLKTPAEVKSSLSEMKAAALSYWRSCSCHRRIR
ncbi:MAG: hypothetical protein H7Z15_18790 [Rhizobacter sp.]|nr:hypothetical protein [Rhizobacter sp.]